MIVIAMPECVNFQLPLGLDSTQNECLIEMFVVITLYLKDWALTSKLELAPTACNY